MNREPIYFRCEDAEVEGVLQDLQDVPEVSDILADSFSSTPKKDDAGHNVFEEKGRKAWNSEKIQARCDMNYVLKISPRCGVTFISIWKKTLYGRLLSEIKEDEKMVNVFATNMAETIQDVIGDNLVSGGYCLITAPRRRHVERNFATLVCEAMAWILNIKFYKDVVHCKQKRRMNAKFSLSLVPVEPNIIVFDDIVTTGSTLASIKQAFEGKGKNLIFFTGINNKL